MTKQYGLVHYQGTVHLNWDHRVVLESDNALEIMDELEQRRLTAPPREGYRVAIRGLDGIGDARAANATSVATATSPATATSVATPTSPATAVQPATPLPCSPTAAG